VSRTSIGDVSWRRIDMQMCESFHCLSSAVDYSDLLSEDAN
jgi:hypothetical protein